MRLSKNIKTLTKFGITENGKVRYYAIEIEFIDGKRYTLEAKDIEELRTCIVDENWNK